MVRRRAAERLASQKTLSEDSLKGARVWQGTLRIPSGPNGQVLRMHRLSSLEQLLLWQISGQAIDPASLVAYSMICHPGTVWQMELGLHYQNIQPCIA